MSYVQNIPNQKCWVIFTPEYYSTDHGYPKDGTVRVEYTDAKFYTDKQLWLDAIRKLEFPKHSSKVAYKAGVFDPKDIVTTIEVKDI